MKKKYWNIVLLILMSSRLIAQDIHFSQYFSLPLLTNPAYAGIHNETKLGLIYRNQYNAIPASYATYGVSFDTYSNFMHGGIGVQVVKDDQANGMLQNHYAGLSYAYQNALSKKIAFSFGMEAMAHFNQINVSKIVVYNMISQQTGQIISSLQSVENINFPSSKFFFDVNSGAVIFNNNFYSGLGVLHLNQPNDGWQTSHSMPLAVNFETGYLFKPSTLKKDDAWYFSPNLLYLNQHGNHEINFTALAGLGHAQAGLGIRNASNMDALIFHFGFLTGTFRVGYSFDLNISTKYFNFRNSHEISLQYVFTKKKKTSDENNWSNNETNHARKRIKCPNFFR